MTNTCEAAKAKEQKTIYGVTYLFESENLIYIF